jgi:hypothetical protein
LSFHNSRTLLDKIDKLPPGPQWKVDSLILTGNIADNNGELLTEDLEIWRRDPLECIAHLIGDPTLKDFMHYEPKRLYSDIDDSQRVYEGMDTCDWWWEMQVRMILYLPFAFT